MSADTESTPIVQLAKISSTKISKRIDALQIFFNDTYGVNATFVVKVPGRYDLIMNF